MGDVIFQNRPLVYTMLILTFVIYYVLFHTPWGLRVRAVGEHPKAADTMGINVYKVRYISVFLSGLVAGLGGVWFSLEQVGHFDMNMIGGKGFIGRGHDDLRPVESDRRPGRRVALRLPRGAADQPGDVAARTSPINS